MVKDATTYSRKRVIENKSRKTKEKYFNICSENCHFCSHRCFNVMVNLGLLLYVDRFPSCWFFSHHANTPVYHFLIFVLKHRLWVYMGVPTIYLSEVVLTCTHEQRYEKNIKIFQQKNVIFTAIKNAAYCIDMFA